jgi:nucleoside-diphosphate-sugar epimerase
MSAHSGSVLVTGASGFIGRHCTAMLAQAGFRVIAVARTPRPSESSIDWVSRDLISVEAVQGLMAQFRPTWLLHLAWYVEPGNFWHSSENLRWLASSVALFEAFGRHGGKRAVGVGSCAEYAFGHGSLSEFSSPLRPETPYGHCKHALSIGLEAAAQCYGFSAAWGRIFMPFGPGEPQEKLLSLVIRALIGRERVPLTDCRQVRDALYVTDVAAALNALLMSSVTGPVNIGSGIGRELREMIELVARRLDGAHLLDYGARQRSINDTDSMIADVERLTREVGWTPTMTFESGLEHTIAAVLNDPSPSRRRA